MFARVLACHRRYFCREQAEQGTILVRCPHASIAPQKTCPRAFFAAKTKRTVKQSGREILETDGNLDELSLQFGGNSIYHAAAHERFADG